MNGLRSTPTERPDPVLELRGVTKAFRRPVAFRRDLAPVVAVDDVSLTLYPGQILGLVGESGAGKSTVGRLILGLDRPDKGEVLVEGIDLARLRERALRRARQRMHLILQDPYQALHPGLRLADIIAEPLVIARVPKPERRSRMLEALRDVGLVPAERFARRFPHELSGGQRQRVAMARALVARPRLAVADEPTSMLDASLRAGVLELITGMRDLLGTAFVFITHDLALARYVCDQIAVMHEGRLVECRETEALIGSPQHEYTESLLAASEGEI
ncbi:MAG: dipeptide/oligopeptide/nickel ABC transporter ATP-binding protein [Actinomycetota bacterium]|nr:dipeptide/oligopeptide/nickel ABC transporter ATP-binding protein [Actinomycetota bacterium]